MMTRPEKHCSLVLIFFLLVNLLACSAPAQTRQVVIYTSVDQVYAEPVLEGFRGRNGHTGQAGLRRGGDQDDRVS